jgi:hypothetical protein
MMAYMNTVGTKKPTSCVGGCLRVGLLWQQFAGGNLFAHPGAALSAIKGKNIGETSFNYKLQSQEIQTKKKKGEKYKKKSPMNFKRTSFNCFYLQNGYLIMDLPLLPADLDINLSCQLRGMVKGCRWGKGGVLNI